MKRNSGFVLLFTMAFILLLTGAVLGFHARCAERTAASRNAIDRIRTREACETGIALGAQIVRGDTNSYDWAGEDWAKERGFSFGDIQIFITISDEDAKINLNAILGNRGAVSTGFLTLTKNLLAVLGHPDSIVDTLLDWMDEDEMPRVFGAEDTYYMGQIPPYHAANQPLRSLRELALIKGFTSEVLYGSEENRTVGILRFVTLSTDSTINVNTCERPVLNALGFADMEADQILTERTERPLDEGFLLRLNRNAYLANKALISLKSSTFLVTCTARTAGGITRKMRAQVRRGDSLRISTIEDI